MLRGGLHHFALVTKKMLVEAGVDFIEFSGGLGRAMAAKKNGGLMPNGKPLPDPPAKFHDASSPVTETLFPDHAAAIKQFQDTVGAEEEVSPPSWYDPSEGK